MAAAQNAANSPNLGALASEAAADLSELRRLARGETDLARLQQVSARLEQKAAELATALAPLQQLVARSTHSLARSTAAAPDDSGRSERLALQSLRAGLVSDRPDRALSAAYTLAQVLRSEGRAAEALPYVDAALALVPEPSPTGPSLLYMRAELQRITGEHREALQSLALAEAAVTPGEARHRLVTDQAPGLRAQILLDMGLPDQAHPWITRALERTPQVGGAVDPFSRSIAHSMNVSHAAAIGAHELVIERVDRALLESGIWEAVPMTRVHLLCARAASRFYLDRRDPEGLSTLSTHLEELLGEQFLQPVDKLDLLLLLADAALRTGQSARAERWIGEANAVVRSPEAPGTPAQRARLVTLRARHWLGEEGIDRDARSLLAEVESEIDELLRQWDHAPVRRAGVGFLLPSQRRELISAGFRLLLAVHGDARGPYECLDLWLRVEAMGSLFRRMRGASRPPTRQQVVALGESGAGVLAYFPSSPTSHLLVIDSEGVAHHQLADVDVLERAVLTDALEPIEQRKLAALLLPGPLRTTVGSWRELSLIGADLMPARRFLELALGAAERLGDRTVRILPSLIVGAELASRPAPAADRTEITVVGDPILGPRARALDDQLAPLPLPDSWRSGVVDAHGGRVTFLTGEDATVRSLQGALSRSRVLHVLTHGVMDPELERPLSLAFTEDGDDGLLTCEDVEQLRGVPPVVILTACDSGRGPARVGDAHVADMAGAWLTAGASAVLVADETLDYAPTLELSAALHEGLGAGLSLEQVLRECRGETRLRRTAERLYVVGKAPVDRPAAGQDRVEQVTFAWMPVGAGCVVGLLAGAMLGRRRRRAA